MNHDDDADADGRRSRRSELLSAARLCNIVSLSRAQYQDGKEADADICASTLETDTQGCEMAMIDALAAKETMFKSYRSSSAVPPTSVLSSSSPPPPWPIHVVPASKFALEPSILYPATLPYRSFEYGASWVEHYYARLVDECKRHDRIDLIEMLYHWYVAQFTLDYMNDGQPLSQKQFLFASNVLAESDCLEGLEINSQRMCRSCRNLMEMHDNALDLLPREIGTDISDVLGDFYASVDKQCLSQDSNEFESMTLDEYMEYRTLNAGGLMGFVRQVRLFSLFYPDGPVDDMDTISRLVGLNVALINDLYGVKKDAMSGEPNIILKHARENQSSVGESVAWAASCIHDTVKDVMLYNKRHPYCLCTVHDIAMGCISGNHGFHESSKRYELPRGFSWSSFPESTFPSYPRWQDCKRHSENSLRSRACRCK